MPLPRNCCTRPADLAAHGKAICMCISRRERERREYRKCNFRPLGTASLPDFRLSRFALYAALRFGCRDQRANSTIPNQLILTLVHYVPLSLVR